MSGDASQLAVRCTTASDNHHFGLGRSSGQGHVRVNWDKGKAIPGLPVSDDDLQKLHRAGMARDYLVGGSTETQTSTVDADPSADAGLPPPTPPASRLEGGRADPGRERGSE